MTNNAPPVWLQWTIGIAWAIWFGAIMADHLTR